MDAAEQRRRAQLGHGIIIPLHTTFIHGHKYRTFGLIGVVVDEWNG